MITRASLEAADRADALAAVRERFMLPPGVVYLDGNSLGPLPRATPERIVTVMRDEWGGGLIRSWNDAGWMEAPARIGDKIARLIGAVPGSVVVADSTSVNLFKLLSAALALRPDRRKIVSEAGNFPTDLYIAEGLTDQLGRGHRLVRAAPEAIAEAIDDDTAVVMITHVNYHTGAMHDMAALTAAAHAKGALMLWDLAHSAGAMPLDLAGCGADFAVGCGYKFLNGGPGAPAFLHVAPRWQEAARYGLTGWLGHAAPFAFEPSYRGAGGMARALVGTPPMLAMAALEVGVEQALAVPLDQVRAKSLHQTALLMDLIDQECAGLDLRIVTPRQAARRGSQVSVAHTDAYAVMQALIARGVIGDFRAPDILRFGITPLYLRDVDLWDAVAVLREVLAGETWRDPRHAVRRAVT